MAPKRTPLIERFQAQYLVAETGCWLWVGSIQESNGYGVIGVVEGDVKKRKYAHRVAHELFIGPIPPGLNVDHQCHNEDLGCSGGPTCPHRACVNPEHLEAVTTRRNIKRGQTGAHEAAKTHCPHGHEYTPENTRRIKTGSGVLSRSCRICHNTRTLAAHHAKTRCPAGHPYDEVNTYIKVSPKAGRSSRHCRACDRERAATKSIV